ncbi:MAG: anaerobic ribonucleoside-triphosphate reductase activating protein, partial [Proteobacteria bacterium]|nr:anaerobic ribonucleoside-triphosphate reductase activating protein [Pseudomonadota bacterium]
MIIGGIQKNSLIDYPEKISCVLFTSGCNFACPYCHNPQLVKNNPNVCIKETEIFDFLESHKNFLDGVVISGGEPTIHDDIHFICKKIKAMGYSVKLDTNGSNPEVIKSLIDEELIDYIAMDIKTDPCRYSYFTTSGFDYVKILSSIQIIMDSKIKYEFRTTSVKPFVDVSVIEKISRIIAGANRYVLQHFHNNNVLMPEFFNTKNQELTEE